jgi:hypothetical protein
MNRRFSFAVVLLLVGAIVGSAPPASAGDPPDAPSGTAAAIEHFEKHIRPLLHEHCYACHSGEAKTLKGGLRLDSKAAIERGGDSGALFVPGKPDESLLIKSIRYDGQAYDMPPDGKLSDRDVAMLTDWVANGAVYPGTDAEPLPAGAEIDFEEGRKHWSFQPLAEQQLPVTAADPWVIGRIDAFILEKQRQHGLAPSPTADRTTLVRRLFFSLVGLPPTPQQIESFVQDPSPEAYDRLVEELLGSPQYGERWGRMWLDLARYTDTTESWLDQTNNAHLYRDWVVKALNEDLPYDQFVRRQLAADQIDGLGLDELPALGFLGLSPTYFKELLLPPDIIKVIVADEWEERVDAVSRTFLGLTVACARCHDHKFDPISTEDYHALAGVFASTKMTSRAMIPNDRYAPVAAAKAEVNKLSEQVANLKKQKPAPEEQIACLEDEIDYLKRYTPDYDTPMVSVVVDESLHVEMAGDSPQAGTKLNYRPEPQDLNIFVRGNPNKLGPVVHRRFLQVLQSPTPQRFERGSGRAELADAIIREAGHLVARVIVNRVWMTHFGRGLVDTPSNFGRLGAKPSHPELLEDLAFRFVENGWSLKWLHREIVGSATYRQSSAAEPSKQSIDPDNRWLWRMNRKRLEVEPWRDAMLAVAGTLDLSLGGPAEAAEDATNRRRTVYAKIHRREVSKMLQLHDFPDPNLHSEQRSETTTALQGLYLLNSPLLNELGKALSERLAREVPDDPVARIKSAHRLLFGRDATDDEIRLALDYMNGSSDGGAGAAWVQYCHALLASNEFQFVD